MQINNAGSNAYSFKPLAEPSDEMNILCDVSLFTDCYYVSYALKMSPLAIKMMQSQPRGSHIFIIDGAGSSSASGSDGRLTPRFAAYGATKRSACNILNLLYMFYDDRKVFITKSLQKINLPHYSTFEDYDDEYRYYDFKEPKQIQLQKAIAFADPWDPKVKDFNTDCIIMNAPPPTNVAFKTMVRPPKRGSAAQRPRTPLSTIAGAMSTTITAPMDMIKTRLMLQRDSKGVGTYKNGWISLCL
ncbi:hypothetical protein ACFE04_011061 [Oxalis oulophora]